MNYISKRDRALWQPPAPFHGHDAAPPTLSRISGQESEVVTKCLGLIIGLKHNFKHDNTILSLSCVIVLYSMLV